MFSVQLFLSFGLRLDYLATELPEFGIRDKKLH